MILPVVEPGGAPLTAASIAAGARRLEAAGFDSVWVFDAIGRGFALPDPLIAAAVAATATERVELGTCVLQVPLRRPVELAHRVLTAHLVCGGRLLLGVGAGSTPDDFAAVGVDYDGRFRALADALDVMQRLWDGERVGEADLTPWPSTTGGPPVLIGSWSGSTWIPRAAQRHAGWIASAAKTTWAQLEEGITRFRDAGGRRAVVTNIVVDLDGRETTDLARDQPLVLRGDAAAARDRLARLAELGFDDAVLLCFDQRPDALSAIRALCS